MTKNEFPSSSSPANMLYQAKNPATMLKPPEAFTNVAFGIPVPFVCASRYPMPSNRNEIQTVAKRDEKKSVDLRVQSHNRKVKMNQPKM